MATIKLVTKKRTRHMILEIVVSEGDDVLYQDRHDDWYSRDFSADRNAVLTRAYENILTCRIASGGFRSFEGRRGTWEDKNGEISAYMTAEEVEKLKALPPACPTVQPDCRYPHHRERCRIVEKILHELSARQCSCMSPDCPFDGIGPGVGPGLNLATKEA